MFLTAVADEFRVTITPASNTPAGPGPLVAALAAAYTPDALDQFAKTIGHRAVADPSGVYRRLADTLVAASAVSLERVTADD